MAGVGGDSLDGVIALSVALSIYESSILFMAFLMPDSGDVFSEVEAVSEGSVSIRLTRGGIRHGEWADLSMNGVYPIDTFIVFIMSKWTFGNALAHPNWFHSMWNLSAWMTVLLDLSEEPSICGWNAVDILCLIPDNFIKAFQNCETNSLSWSVMSSYGQPFSLNQQSQKMLAKSSAIMFILHGAI